MMSFLIDSNVLISSYDETEKQHPESYMLVEKAIGGELQAFLAHQNLLEYLAVTTDPLPCKKSLICGKSPNKY